MSGLSYIWSRDDSSDLGFESPVDFAPDGCGVWVYFCICDLNPNMTRTEPDSGADFIFSPAGVHET
jgi:hypothetical protein